MQVQMHFIRRLPAKALTGQKRLAGFFMRQTGGAWPQPRAFNRRRASKKPPLDVARRD
jgi:hypothetical protein